jgi:thymidylate synthase (FAD)
MKIIRPSVEFLWMTQSPLEAIELAGRTCYKSEDRITSKSAEKFIHMLLNKGHEAMLEHASMSYRIVCDRGVTHEIVRHRLFSYAQESTRYVNYKDGIEVISPFNDVITPEDAATAGIWQQTMQYCESTYRYLIENGEKPQIARAVLPTCVKTEIVVTGNMREWRHFFKLRTAKDAHPQMQEVANMLLFDATYRVPILFDEY